MCYSTKVMMLRFVVLLTLTVALAECRVSVLKNIIIHVHVLINNVLNCAELYRYCCCG